MPRNDSTGEEQSSCCLTSAFWAHSARHLRILGFIWGRLGAATPILQESTPRLSRHRAGLREGSGGTEHHARAQRAAVCAHVGLSPRGRRGAPLCRVTSWDAEWKERQDDSAGFSPSEPPSRGWAVPCCHPMSSRWSAGAASVGEAHGVGPWSLPVQILPQLRLLTETNPSFLTTSSTLRRCVLHLLSLTRHTIPSLHTSSREPSWIAPGPTDLLA